MKIRLAVALATAAALAAATLPAQAQRGGIIPPRASHGHHLNASSNFQQHVFVPGFGLRPVIQERFPVFGLGFDAHHFNVLNFQNGFFPVHRGFLGGGFFGNNFFATGFFPFASSSVVVVPQAVSVQVPVQVSVNDVRRQEARVVVAPGLPPEWGQVRVAAPSYPRERAPLAQLTLLVLKDHTIFAVTDYWLEDGRIFYVSSTGKQSSVPVRDLDWEMTIRLNAERGVEFVLRSTS